jgi:hypothetical protein
MNPTLKAHIFDAETSLKWAREAIEERDQIATIEALREAQERVTAALEEARQHYIATQAAHAQG